MDAQILNRDFQTQCIIDGFESFIWVDRYNEPGAFELYLPVERAPLEYIVEGWYVWIRDSDRLCIIEDIQINTDAEEGPHITFNGRTLESILDRKRVYAKTTIDGNLQSGIQQLLNENVISPSDSTRKIPGLRFIWNDDPRVTKLTMTEQYLGEDLLTIIEEQCVLNDLGFKIIYNEELGTLDFSLYYGEDRSYDQDDLPWVVFSDRYDNLIGSSYYESKKELRTAAIVVGGDDEKLGQFTIEVVGKSEFTGLDRREMYVDASDIDIPEMQEVDEDEIRQDIIDQYGDIYSDDRLEREIQRAIAQAHAEAMAANSAAIEDYKEALRQRGYAELAQTYITEAFEGTIEASIQYIYGRDYFVGDVVQVRNEYGKEASSRITEVIRCHDVDGVSLIPTFTTLLGGSNKGAITG